MSFFVYAARNAAGSVILSSAPITPGGYTCPICGSPLTPSPDRNALPAFLHTATTCDILTCRQVIADGGAISSAFPPYGHILEEGSRWWLEEGCEQSLRNFIDVLGSSFSGLIDAGYFHFQVSRDKLASLGQAYFTTSGCSDISDFVELELDRDALFSDLESSSEALASGVPPEDIFLAVPSPDQAISWNPDFAMGDYTAAYSGFMRFVAARTRRLSALPSAEAARILLSDVSVLDAFSWMLDTLESDMLHNPGLGVLFAYRELLSASATASIRFYEMLSSPSLAQPQQAGMPSIDAYIQPRL